MELTAALITDLHFGPEARHDGRLRKLTGRAGELTRAFVARMNSEVRPDLVVNLGDDIEDESPEADLSRYRECNSILRGASGQLVHVAGNHDTIHLKVSDLLSTWGPGPWEGSTQAHYSFDHGGCHFTVLHTHEKKDVEITVGRRQLEWLAADLAATSLPTVVLMHHSAADQDLRGNHWFEGSPDLCLVQERAELRTIIESVGGSRVRAVFNGHLHCNHLDVIHGIPYITLQSLIENLDDDAPGRPAAAHAVAHITDRRLVVEIEGAERARYQFER